MKDVFIEIEGGLISDCSRPYVLFDYDFESFDEDDMKETLDFLMKYEVRNLNTKELLMLNDYIEALKKELKELEEV